MCAEAVLKEKSVNKNIALICCVPYDGFADKWDKDDRQKYDYIVSNSDELVFVCRHYSKYCFQLRNVYMVDNSSRLITAYNGCSGGTKNTVKYAKSKAIDIINLLD